MIPITHIKCAKDCKAFLDHGTNGCIFEYQKYGTNRPVSAPLGHECPYHGEEIPETPYQFKAVFPKPRTPEGKLATQKVSRN